MLPRREDSPSCKTDSLQKTVMGQEDLGVEGMYEWSQLVHLLGFHEHHKCLNAAKAYRIKY